MNVVVLNILINSVNCNCLMILEECVIIKLCYLLYYIFLLLLSSSIGNYCNGHSLLKDKTISSSENSSFQKITEEYLITNA